MALPFSLVLAEFFRPSNIIMRPHYYVRKAFPFQETSHDLKNAATGPAHDHSFRKVVCQHQIAQNGAIVAADGLSAFGI